MIKHFSIAILLLSLVFAGCSEYNKVLKSDDYQAKFDLANSLYTKGSTLPVRTNKKKIEKYGPVIEGKYGKADLNQSIALYEQIYQKSSKSAEGELAYFRIGKAYYFTGDYYMAGYFLGMFSKRFPASVKAEESLFLSAMCAVNNSPSYELDQQETELAINELQNFIDQFPNSYLVDSCNHTIDRLKYKFEKKDFEAVELYAKTENYRAAVSYGKYFVETYPLSKHLEEVWYLRVKNSYLYASESIDSKKKERYSETIESYRNFVSLFPDSEYRNELDGFSKKSESELALLENKTTKE